MNDAAPVPAPPVPGMSVRPMTMADVDAVADLIRDCELVDVGRPVFEAVDVEAVWSRPSFTIETDSIGLWEDDRLVAGADVLTEQWASGDVRPSHRGLGLGSWLLSWIERRSAELGFASSGQSVIDGCAGERLLRGRGYQDAWTSWTFALPAGQQFPPATLPPGYAIRDCRPGAEERTAYELIENAFREWPGRADRSFVDWVPRVTGRRGFEPWNLRLVTDDAGVPVGAAYTQLDGGGGAFVDMLAVRRDRRGLGLGKALLCDAFAGGRARGATEFELSTDDRTGAKTLYERVGMTVIETWHHLAKDL